MSGKPPLSPLPKKPGEKKAESPEEQGNVKVSDLFKDNQASSMGLSPPPSSPKVLGNIPPSLRAPLPTLQPPPQPMTPAALQPQTIYLDAIPTREEPKQESPGLYKGTPDQAKYFNSNPESSQFPTPGSEPSMDEDIFVLRKKLTEKEKEIDDIFGTFKEIKGAYETLNIQKQNLETQIGSLKSSLELKETHIKTLGETIKMKDEQLAMKSDQVKMKEDQIQIYQKTVEEKNKSLDQMKAQSVDKSVITQKDSIIKQKEEQIKEFQAKIKSMEEEADLLKGDIDSADQEVEQLNQKLQNILSEAKDATFLNRTQVVEKVKSILKDSLHNVNLTVPSIQDLADLNIYDVKTSVALKISCEINMGNPKHAELQQEFLSFDNITLRIFEDKDRWLILKDGDQLFMAVVGNAPEKYLAFSTSDPKHIKFFNSLAMESWLRGRQVKK